ncbi:hypothetical protein B0H14DRAFT_3146235 [Mycena olivaceomarginata]|nr:hypothetical protein B0H14DRAFT_3146235 [Mycena olivaceomarginata]
MEFKGNIAMEPLEVENLERGKLNLEDSCGDCTPLHWIRQVLLELISRQSSVKSGGVNPGVLKKLDAQRDDLRKFLQQTRIVPNAFAFNPLFGWLEGIITHRHDPAHKFARSYFQNHYIHLRTCPGDQQTPSHFHLKRLTAGLGFNLTATLCQTYNGDVEKWFREIIRINRSPDAMMLILELPAEWDGKRPLQWNFPQSIRLSTAGAETMHGVVYDIVGRAFSDGNHFKATFTPDEQNVYSYDDTDSEHKGCAILRSDATLTGKIPSKSGWRTYAVVYRLRGGMRAQSFFKSQIATAQRVHSIVFASSSAPSISNQIPDVVGLDLPNVTEMAAEDRFWFHHPLKQNTIDFVSSQSVSNSVKGRVRFVKEDGDGEDDVSDSPRPAKKRRSLQVFSDGNKLWMLSVVKRDIGADVGHMVDDIRRFESTSQTRDTTWLKGRTK